MISNNIFLAQAFGSDFIAYLTDGTILVAIARTTERKGVVPFYTVVASSPLNVFFAPKLNPTLIKIIQNKDVKFFCSKKFFWRILTDMLRSVDRTVADQGELLKDYSRMVGNQSVSRIRMWKVRIGRIFHR